MIIWCGHQIVGMQKRTFYWKTKYKKVERDIEKKHEIIGKQVCHTIYSCF